MGSLQQQHRLEEICSRFGVPIEAVEAGCRIPFAGLEKVRYEGRPLNAEGAAGRAKAAGLSADAEGVLAPWGADIEALEDSLLAFFDELLTEDPEAFLRMPAQVIQTPATGEMPRSAGYLKRFYGDGFAPREKKPAVVDLRRSQGAFLRSVDDDALQIVDAASQIASLAAGFRPGKVQARLDEGRFDPYLVSAPSPSSRVAAPAVEAYRDALLELAPPGLEHVCFVNAGAEANEKAFHIARINGPGGKRVFAFKGSFHGRTLLSLFSTWNPVKRAPYQLPGFETVFVSLPASEDPYADPPPPAGWVASWSDMNGERGSLAGDGTDPLLKAEVVSLLELEARIREGDGLACIIEPYQCEGGDQSPTRRFFLGLRALTRAYGLPLIFDEVQSGFGLSGAPFWHQNFKLIDADGHPDGPDLVAGAKRAQVGYVLSRWPDPELTTTHAASLVRGLAHLELVLTRVGHAPQARRRLEALAGGWAGVVSRPRVFGDAFAFDMPSRAAANHLIGQRFYRGYMVYIAGERTLRYRLNRGMRPADVDAIFDVIERSLEALVAQAGGPGDDLAERMATCKPPAWDAPDPVEPKALPGVEAVLGDRRAADLRLRTEGPLSIADRAQCASLLGLSAKACGDEAVPAIQAADAAAFFEQSGIELARFAADAMGSHIVRVGVGDFDRHAAAIQALESDAYEPARQDSLAYLRALVAADGGVCLLAFDPDGLVGMTYGAPLELWPGVDGPRQDPHRGAGNTLYSADLTVASRARGRGVGYRLRVALLQAGLEARTEAGAPRYAFITGRNRVGEADAMWSLNQRFGAYEVEIYAGQYGEQSGLSLYYRLPLRRHDRRAFEAEPFAGDRLEFGEGINQPTGPCHPLLVRARSLGVFDEPSLTKLTVSNFITAPYARYSEWLQGIAPEGNKHIYFTSCPDEMVDKAIRALKHNRSAAHVCIGLQGGYVGHTTAASRSLSAPGGTDPANGFFGWPLLPHPNEGAAFKTALAEVLADAGGAEAVIGIFVEAIQAKTGEVISDAAWADLCAWRDETGVPIVLVETTSGFYRSGRGTFFWVDTQAQNADVVLWWAGGQIGHVFSSPARFVSKPLTLISTWDGDELSACRLLWQFYATELTDVGSASQRLESILEGAGLTTQGEGLYRVLHAGKAQAKALSAALSSRGVDVAMLTDERLAFSPALTVDAVELARFEDALGQALAQIGSVQ